MAQRDFEVVSNDKKSSHPNKLVEVYWYKNPNYLATIIEGQTGGVCHFY